MTTDLPHRLADIQDRYDLVLCDVWGVIHNGRRAFSQAVAALEAFRAARGPVVLISNAPRPSDVIPGQLDRLGVSRGAWDAIVTSGDATRAEIAARGPNAYRIGPGKDDGLYDGLEVRFVGADAADYIICTGLRDELNETAADYAAEFAPLLDRDVPMVCANPDLVVQFGDRLIPCAGALAQAYEGAGGEVVMAGKPFAPIYRLAYAEGERLAGRPVDRRRILAIGDGLRTDVKGAQMQGLDCLFIADGIHAEELTGPDGLDAVATDRFLADHGTTAAYAMAGLR